MRFRVRRGGALDFMTNMGTSDVARRMKAKTRVAQPNPTRGCSCLKRMGKTIPPSYTEVQVSASGNYLIVQWRCKGGKGQRTNGTTRRRSAHG